MNFKDINMIFHPNQHKPLLHHKLTL
uniref:Uncharacterized protein n=1 Tax=Arundo donax TaxID=35708 RepID=A0A0A9C483_ARUDO